MQRPSSRGGGTVLEAVRDGAEYVFPVRTDLAAATHLATSVWRFPSSPHATATFPSTFPSAESRSVRRRSFPPSPPPPPPTRAEQTLLVEKGKTTRFRWRGCAAEVVERRTKSCAGKVAEREERACPAGRGRGTNQVRLFRTEWSVRGEGERGEGNTHELCSHTTPSPSLHPSPASPKIFVMSKSSTSPLVPPLFSSNDPALTLSSNVVHEPPTSSNFCAAAPSAAEEGGETTSTLPFSPADPSQSTPSSPSPWRRRYVYSKLCGSVTCERSIEAV